MFDLLWNKSPINDLVSGRAEQPFSRFGQEHELLNALDFSFAFEPCDELASKPAPLMTSADCQRAQQGTGAEALHPDRSENCVVFLKHPEMQIGGARKVSRREPTAFKKRDYGCKVDATAASDPRLRRRHPYAQQSGRVASGSLFGAVEVP